MDNRLQVKAGALVTRQVRSGSISKQTSKQNTSQNFDATELRDFRHIIDNLRKDSERKDSRNDKISKDMVALRTIVANQERDIRILNNTLEKITSERTKLAHEVLKAKDHNEKLEHELSIANDTELWKKLIRESKDEAAYYKDEAERLQGFVKVREENMTNLEKEVQILRRALNAQKVYEPETSSSSSTATNGNGVKSTATAKEIIKALYYDLGRCQTDSHNLALTLAEKHKEIENMYHELTSLRMYKDDITPQIDQLLVHVDDLAEQNHIKDGQIEELNAQVEKHMSTGRLYEQQIETLAKKLSDNEAKYHSSLHDKDMMLEEFQVALPKAQRESVIAQGRADILQQAIIHHENQTKLAQQRVDLEWSKITVERTKYDEIMSQNNILSSQLDELRQAFTSTLIAKEELSSQFASFKEEYLQHHDDSTRHNQSLQSQVQDNIMQLDHAKQHEMMIIKERDDALDALQQTMQAVKDLTNKYKESKSYNESLEKRTIEAEKMMDAMKRSKEHISTAVLDALHKERSKTASLEKILQEMPVERRFHAGIDTLSPIRHQITASSSETVTIDSQGHSSSYDSPGAYSDEGSSASDEKEIISTSSTAT